MLVNEDFISKMQYLEFAALGKLKYKGLLVVRKFRKDFLVNLETYSVLRILID